MADEPGLRRATQQGLKDGEGQHLDVRQFRAVPDRRTYRGPFRVEPTFTPHWAMSLVFFVKRQMSRLTSGRIEILGTWNNIGAPVVSYYSPDELRDLVTQAGAEVEEIHSVEAKLRLLPRLLGVSGRWETTLIARRPDR